MRKTRLARFVSTLFVLTPLATGSAGALAAQMTLQATTTLVGLTDFTVTFDDTGDGKLQLSEVVSFSGFVASPPAIPSTMSLTSILRVPNIAGFATTSCAPGDTSCFPSNWLFGPGNLEAHGLRWTYCFDCAAPAVPEPSTWVLMGLGLLGLGLARRRAPKLLRAAHV